MNRMPKPKPKIEKPLKEETANEENTTSSSYSTSSETSETGQNTADFINSTNIDIDQESDAHDEL